MANKITISSHYSTDTSKLQNSRQLAFNTVTATTFVISEHLFEEAIFRHQLVFTGYESYIESSLCTESNTCQSNNFIFMSPE